MMTYNGYDTTFMSLWDSSVMEKDCFGGNDAVTLDCKLFDQKVEQHDSQVGATYACQRSTASNT
jgi:hypothetical protein